MLAVDTNILIRYFLNDDRAQASRARKLVDANEIFVPKTVFLETEWVLRSIYDFAPEQISAALRGFAGLPKIHVENAETVAHALDWYDKGLDFADALHLAASDACTSFTTFDKAFAKVASRVTGKTVGAPDV
jgi:predicted nucleic-acid-binding protein